MVLEKALGQDVKGQDLTLMGEMLSVRTVVWLSSEVANGM